MISGYLITKILLRDAAKIIKELDTTTAPRTPQNGSSEAPAVAAPVILDQHPATEKTKAFLRKFYLRRLWRICPAMLGMVFGNLLLCFLLYRAQHFQMAVVTSSLAAVGCGYNPWIQLRHFRILCFATFVHKLARPFLLYTPVT